MIPSSIAFERSPTAWRRRGCVETPAGCRGSVSRGVAADDLRDQPSQQMEGFHRQLRQVTQSQSLHDGRCADDPAVPRGPRGQRNWTKRLPNGGETLGQLVISFETA